TGSWSDSRLSFGGSAVARLFFRRIGNQSLQEGNAFDQLGYALQRQQCEAHRDQQLRRPHDEAASVGRNLVSIPGIQEYGDGQPENDEGHRQEKEQAAEYFDPGLRPPRKTAGYDVDADVLVTQERVSGAQQENGGEQVPLELQPRVGAHIERVTD